MYENIDDERDFHVKQQDWEVDVETARPMRTSVPMKIGIESHLLVVDAVNQYKE